MEEEDGIHSHNLQKGEEMRKGVQIDAVRIVGKMVEALTKDGESIKITRAQRELLRKYNNPNYIEDICKAFSNNDVVAKAFIVIKDGESVFTR